MRKFSEIIRELREDRYTQQELANKLGVSKSTIGMWETDKRLPSKEVYEHIADWLWENIQDRGPLGNTIYFTSYYN